MTSRSILAALLLIGVGVALDSGTGRRGGSDIYAAGIFDVSSSNRAGNSEQLGEELGEELGESVLQLDAAKGVDAVSAAQQATAKAVATVEPHFAFNSTHMDEKIIVNSTHTEPKRKSCRNVINGNAKHCTTCANGNFGLIPQSTQSRFGVCWEYSTHPLTKCVRLRGPNDVGSDSPRASDKDFLCTKMVIAETNFRVADETNQTVKAHFNSVMDPTTKNAMAKCRVWKQTVCRGASKRCRMQKEVQCATVCKMKKWTSKTGSTGSKAISQDSATDDSECDPAKCSGEYGAMACAFVVVD